MKTILSLDLGTTSCRAILFDHNGKIINFAQREFKQYYPKPGWVEHDAEEIFDNTVYVAETAIKGSGIPATDIVSIGITNQRETTVIWDKTTGVPIGHAIVWQCRRTAPIIDELEKNGYGELIKEKTGLVPDAYFSGTKIKWLLENTPGAREKAESGKLLFGTIDSWIIWKLTGGRAHVTDMTNASRTMIFNIHDLCWDKELLKILDIPYSVLPEVKQSSERYGFTRKEFFGAEIPISGAAGDQQCALFGQCCFNPGDIKNTYGTGCFLLMNTGKEIIKSSNGLVSTIAVAMNGSVQYALEGSVFVAGAAIQWLRDELKVLSSAKESYEIAMRTEDTAGCYIVPAFTGLGAPYWNQDARGMIVGITRGMSREHLVKATLDSLAYQSYDLVKCMQMDAGVLINRLKVDGGACENDYLMQFQSDLLGCEVIRYVNKESTALGAAYLAGLAEGFWTDRSEIENINKVDRVFKSGIEDAQRQKYISGWKKAVRCALYWANDEEA